VKRRSVKLTSRWGAAAAVAVVAAIGGCWSAAEDAEPVGQANAPGSAPAWLAPGHGDLPESEESTASESRMERPSEAPAAEAPFRQRQALDSDPMAATGSLDDGEIAGLGLGGTGRGGGGSGNRYGIAGPGYAPPRGMASPSPRPRSSRTVAARPLPQNGVLANNFVGGRGVQARLDDLLDRGVMIDGEQVRIEAFEDRGRLPYAVPTEEAVALHTELERTKVSTDGDTVHLQIALLAKQGEAPPRPRMDVRLVFDRSGSMRSEGKWQHAVAAARALVDELEPTDTFGLVSYSDTATLDVAPTRVGNGQAIRRAIDAMRPGGGTNIGAALELARQNAPERRRPTDVGLVILLSDGMATAGITDPRTLGRTVRKMFDDGGVLTTSIGVGTSFDEETMLTVAREGSGSYHFVRRAADVGTILQDELEDRVQAVAQALRVRVVLGGGVVARKVYGTRLLSEEEHAQVRATEVANDTRIARELGITRDREQEEDEGLRMHLPTFRRGDQHVILMELEVPGGRAESIAGVARVYLEYKDLLRRDNAEASRVVTAERVADQDGVAASTERTVKRTVLAFQAGEALQLAADSLTARDAAEARRLLSERRELLEAAADVWRDPSLRQDAALLARYEQVVAHAWGGFGDADQRTLVMAMNYFGDQRMR